MLKIGNSISGTLKWILIVWFVLGIIVFVLYPTLSGDKAFVDSYYNAIVDSIEFRPGHRGTPHIKLKSGWRLLNLEEMKIIHYLQNKDSIVKERGSRTIKVYRKEKTGALVQRDFD